MKKSTFTFTDPDGFHIFVYKWTPDEGVTPRAAVQIAHGAAEHALRYEDFARFLTDHGFVVYANDHRGHGETAGSLENLGWAGEDGWNGIMKDVHQLSEIIRQEYPDLPLFFFGHSMGSLIAQQYIQNWGDELKGAVLSGTFSSLGDDMAASVALAEKMVEEEGPRAPSMLLAQMFGAFNQAFQPAKTGFEWLSRDEAVVQQYVDDPKCGFPFSNQLVADFFKGGLETWKEENEAKIPKDLPILMISGSMDPAGGNTVSVKQLADRYRRHGVRNLKVIFYPEARHEVLNEINREEVYRDVLEWIEGVLAGH